jgi:hypothetical protein
MTERQRRRRGFMTVAALFLVGLVAASLAIVATAAATDLRRTRTVVSKAQLRQLLLAAGADVASRATAWGDVAPGASWTLAMPAELPGYAVQVRVRPGGAGTAEATVTADGEGLRATQRLTWTRRGGRWALAAVEMNGA